MKLINIIIMKKSMLKRTINLSLLFTGMVIFVLSCEGLSFEDLGIDTGQSGSMARFVIDGDYLYTVDRQSLKYFDISDAAKPVYKSKINVGFDVETIFSRGNLLFIGAETAMYIYSISVPGNPVRLSGYSHVYSCDPVVANDNYAFVTLSTSSWCGRWANELDIIDISDPSKPFEVSTYAMNNPKGLGLKGNKLYLCDDNLLKIYDVSDVNNIELLTSINNKAYDVIPMENTLITIGEKGFYQYEYSGDSLELISQINIETN